MKRQILGPLTVCLMLVAMTFGTAKNALKMQPVSGWQITIRIRDYAQANPLVRQRGVDAASEILHKAGVATRWIDCPVGSSGAGDCSSALSPFDFVINLLPYSMSERLHQGEGVLGYAIEASGKDFGLIASVFYDVAKERAAEQQQNLGELLGDAIAHELGHLLLGTNSHSLRGLMSAFWSGNQLRLASEGCLFFSEAEAKRIQAALNARALAATLMTPISESSRMVPTRKAFSEGVQSAAHSQ